MNFGINALRVKPGQSRGGDPYLRELVAHLARADAENEYRLFVSAADRDEFGTDAPNQRVIVSPVAAKGRLSLMAMEQLWLPMAARRAGVQVMLCPTASIPRLLSPPAVIAIQSLLSFHPEFWARQGGSLRRWQSRARGRYFRATQGAMARRAAAVLAVSEQTRRETARYCAVDPARIVVARHGVSDQFRPVDDAERIATLLERFGLCRPFLLIVDALSPYKNLDRALEGLAQVRRWSHRLPMLALIGEDRFGCRSRLERQVVALDLEAQVRFPGVVPRNQLPALYTAATATLSLSSCEASGLSLVEAMACGCPVICARRSSLPEVAGDAALFVDPDRPQEVAEAIWRLSTLPNVREAWVEAALRRAEQFDWQETARLTRDVLIAVAQGRPLPKSPAAGRPSPVETAEGTGWIRE